MKRKKNLSSFINHYVVPNMHLFLLWNTTEDFFNILIDSALPEDCLFCPHRLHTKGHLVCLNVIFLTTDCSGTNIYFIHYKQFFQQENWGHVIYSTIEWFRIKLMNPFQFPVSAPFWPHGGIARYIFQSFKSECSNENMLIVVDVQFSVVQFHVNTAMPFHTVSGNMSFSCHIAYLNSQLHYIKLNNLSVIS